MIIKDFTKSDFRNGMIVQLKNGDKRLYWCGRLIDEDGYIDLNKYNKDLTNSVTDDDDVVKIYTNGNVMRINDFFRSSNLELMWERKEPLPIDEEELKKAIELIDCYCPHKYGLQSKYDCCEDDKINCFRCWRDSIIKINK